MMLDKLEILCTMVFVNYRVLWYEKAITMETLTINKKFSLFSVLSIMLLNTKWEMKLEIRIYGIDKAAVIAQLGER